MKQRRRKKTHVITSEAERDALSSAIRLEIIGHFAAPGGLSIGDIADRIGRPATALYYHFRILEETGLLLRVGSRPGTKRQEALFQLVAERLELPAEPGSDSVTAALKTMSAAFRMAERDMEAALKSGNVRTAGKSRNFFAARVHARLTKQALAEINQHFKAIEAILEREGRRKELPPDADQYCSLTLALLPLRGRDT